MDPEHIVARRDLRSRKSSLASDVGLLALCFCSGLLGVYYESVTLIFAIFIGGLLIWLAIGFRDWMASMQEKREEAKAKAAKEAEAKAAAERGLPPPEAVSKLIAQRRSIFPKDYTGAKIPKGKIELLLEAANWAPTHNLTEPWRFVVLEGESKARFEDLTIQLVGKYTQPEEKAAEAVERMKGKASKTWPLVSHYVVICMSRQPGKGGKLNPEWEDLAAVACAVQNMYLLATSMGLAPYWSSWQAVARDAPEMAEFLGLGEGGKCLGVFTLGISERAASYRGSRKPVADKVTWMS